MTSIPMDYPMPVHMHPHDIVFHQMLRSAQLPSAIPFRPERPSIDIYARLERRAAQAARWTSQSSDDSDVDDGYHADRDNGPSKLLKVTCDYFLEIVPSSSKKSRCHACHSDLRSSAYRLRSIDTNEQFHVHCFESQYNLDQGFGRIYPCPASLPSSGRGDQPRLDDGARELVKSWKMQRRQEGLAEAAGPDSGIPTGVQGPLDCAPGISSPRIGQKRASVEVEDDVERKRAKFERRNTAPEVYQNDDPLRPTLLRSRSSGSRGRQGSLDDGPILPHRLSDALKRLDGLPRRFSDW